MAIAKHYLGTNESKGNYYDVFRKWLPEEDVTYRDMKKEIIKAYALKEVIFEHLKQLRKEEELAENDTDGD